MKKFVPAMILAMFFLHLTTGGAYANETYTVKSGDNLWKIAQTYNTSVNKLIELNNLPNDFLNIGQKLIVKATPPNSVVATTPAASETVPPANATYTVVSGDNLWLIANQFNTSVDSIKELNNLESDALYVGQVLNITASTTDATSYTNVSRGGAPSSGDRIVQYAAKFLGTPYRYGGKSPAGFDCSGFTSYVFEQFGINLYRTAADQYKHGVAVAKDELQIGDLVFFAGGSSIDHVGIYSGNGQIIHSSSPTSGGVIYSTLNSGYYANTYVGAKRIL